MKMKDFGWLKLSVLFCLLILFIESKAQRYARANGNWNTAIWAATPTGIAGSAPTPTATDDAYTNGSLVTVSVNATCRNLFITYNLANSLTLSSLRILTVTGTLNGYDDAGAIEQIPTAAVLSFNAGSTIVFTAANIQPAYDPYVIFFWDNTVPLGRVTFNLGALSKNIIIPLSISTIMRLQSGTLSADPGSNLNGNSTATFQVDAGATFNTNDPLTNFNNYQISGTLTTSGTISAAGGAGSLTVNSGGVLNSTGTSGTISTASTNISGTLNISNALNASGTLTINSGGVLNSTGTSGTISTSSTTISGTINTSNPLNTSGTFQMNATGILTSSFSGGNQTEGWWSLTNRPSSTILDPASIINYSGGSQNIYAMPYSNLTFSGSGTKTVVGSGSLNISGNLTFSISSIILTSSLQTIFNGSTAQNISGGGTANFNGGFQVNKSAGTLTLSQNISIQNGLTLTAGTMDFGSNTVSLSGNLVNNATLTPSGSTLSITGTAAMSGSSATSLNSVTITGTGNLTPPSTLNIAGNFTNNGTFTNNSGAVALNGSTLQSIAGTTTFNNISTSNAAGVNNNGALTLNGILSFIGSGVFNANGTGAGTLTLASPGISTGGMIGAIPTPGTSFTGTVTTQRFINGPGDWRYISMPITNGNVGMWQSAFPVTGNFSNPSPNGINGVVDQTAASVYYFDAPTQAYVAVGAGGTTTGTTLSNTVGYSAYTYAASNVTVSATGTIAQGAVNIPLSTTAPGWNLVPNPYPSAISWDLIIRTGLSNTMSLRTANNTFATYLAGSGTCVGCGFNSNWRGEIPIGQSFWVNSASATNLGLTEAVKTTTQPTFVRQAAAQNFVRITLHSPTEVDDAVVMFRPGATINFDTLYDGLKRKNGNYVSNLGINSYINISSYTTNSKKDMAINGMPPVGCTESVKLKVADTPVGSYTLVFTELKSINLGYSVTLVDHFLSKQITITDSLQYGFTITADTNSFGTGRFEMQFLAPQVNAASPSLSVSNRCDPANLPVNFTSQAGINYQFMIGGNPVSAIANGTGQAVTAIIDKTKLVAGSNAIDLVATTAGGCSTKTFSSAFQYQLNALANMPKVVNDTICQSAKASLTANGAPANGSYLWYDSLNKTTPIPGVTGATFQTDTLSATRTYYVLAVNGDGCQSTRASITVAVIPIAKPIVTVNGQLLNSNSASGNQWLLNGSPIAGASAQQYKAITSGTYSLKVTNSSSCSKTSNDVVMVVTGLETGVNDEIINAYPNPVKDQLQLSAPKGFENLKLFDSQGRILETMNALNPGDPISLQIDFSAYSKGLYLINVIVGGKNYFVKIIKD